MRAPAGSSPSTLRVLLIDEDPVRRARGSARLKALAPGISVLEAQTGLDYASHLAAGPLDAAIAARDLSWASGPDVLARIRARNPQSVTVLLDATGPASGDDDADWDRVSTLVLGCTERESAADRDRRKAGRGGPSPQEALARLGASLERVRCRGKNFAPSTPATPSGCSSSECSRIWYETSALLAGMAELLGLEAARVGDSGPADVGDAVLEAMRALAPWLTRAGARVMAGPLPTLRADGRDLRLLFYHLIDNAIRFRAEASPRVTVRARALDVGWELSVEDNGIGVEDQEMETLFEMFRRGMRELHPDGAGLGLGVCRHIARKYGGSIAFEAARSEGAKVLVRLAVEAVAPERLALEVLFNDEPVGRINVSPRADKADITYAALSLPRMSELLGDLTIKDVRVSDAQAVNIIA